jgi:hypothetical protein
MKESSGREEYLKLFGGDKDKIKNAVEYAHKIRSFEIELYWKRATYFWAILAVSFAGYFTAQGNHNYFGAVVVSYIGLILGFAWYLVNRGSSRWQQNWEFHVDLLEDEVTGPLYKTLINSKLYSIWDMAGAYPFSPTRVNAIISIFATIVWLPLILKANYDMLIDASTGQFEALLSIFLAVGCLVGIAALVGSGSSRKRPGHRKIEARTREYD